MFELRPGSEALPRNIVPGSTSLTGRLATCARIADAGRTFADPSKRGNLSSRHSGKFTALLARIGNFLARIGQGSAAFTHAWKPGRAPSSSPPRAFCATK